MQKKRTHLHLKEADELCLSMSWLGTGGRSLHGHRIPQEQTMHLKAANNNVFVCDYAMDESRGFGLKVQSLQGPTTTVAHTTGTFAKVEALTT